MTSFRVTLLLLVLSAVVSLGQDPYVRVTLPAAHEGLWSGQRITCVVELGVPGYFSGVPAFEAQEPVGVLVIPPMGSPLLGSETRDGIAYTTQRHEVFLFVRQTGTVTIPPMTIRLAYKKAALDREVMQAALTTEPITLEVKRPEGIGEETGLISSADYRATEHWQPEPGSAKVGDAITRTITRTATDVPAMAMPPFPEIQIPGVKVYHSPPTLTDRQERGTTYSERVDQITYVFEQSDTVVLPAMQVAWFDLVSRHPRSIELPAQKITVAPNPAMGGDAGKLDAPGINKGVTSWIVLLFAVLVIALLIKPLRRVWAVFRPVHLAPLNPHDSFL